MFSNLRWVKPPEGSALSIEDHTVCMRKLSYAGRKLSENLRRWLTTKIVVLSLVPFPLVVRNKRRVLKSIQPVGKVPIRESFDISGLDAEKRRQSFLGSF